MNLGSYYSRDNLLHQSPYFCLSRGLNALARNACAALRSPTYAGLRGAFNFDKTGSVSAVDISADSTDRTDPSTPRDLGFVWVIDTTIHDGDFVSLLPGTYGLHFTNSIDLTSDQLGVVVQ